MYAYIHIYIYIYIYIHTHYIRGNHLSNTTCLTHASGSGSRCMGSVTETPDRLAGLAILKRRSAVNRRPRKGHPRGGGPESVPRFSDPEAPCVDYLTGGNRKPNRAGRTEPAKPNRTGPCNFGTGQNQTRNRTESDRATTEPNQLIFEEKIRKRNESNRTGAFLFQVAWFRIPVLGSPCRGRRTKNFRSCRWGGRAGATDMLPGRIVVFVQRASLPFCRMPVSEKKHSSG